MTARLISDVTTTNASDVIYFSGDESTDGSQRIIWDGTDLKIQDRADGGR